MHRLTFTPLARTALIVLVMFSSACLSPPIGGGPSGDESLEALLEDSEGRPAEEFARDLRSLTLKHPRHVPTLLADAATSLESGRTERAFALLQRLLALEPDNVDGVLMATSIAARTGNLDAARRRIETALNTRPDDPDLHQASAALLHLDGRADEALTALDQSDALAGGPTWRSAYHRGLVAEMNGDFNAAYEHYTDALEAKPDFEGAARRRRWLAVQSSMDPAAPQP